MRTRPTKVAGLQVGLPEIVVGRRASRRDLHGVSEERDAIPPVAQLAEGAQRQDEQRYDNRCPDRRRPLREAS